MMKLATSCILLACMASPLLASFVPSRITLDSLVNGNSDTALQNALTEVGLVSITNIDGLQKRALFESLENCMSSAPRRIFPDGTHRRTLATKTLPEGMEPLDCSQEHSNSFRHAVDQVTKVVADRLDKILGSDLKLLESSSAAGQPYSIDQIVHQGEHLEHFHAYYKESDDVESTIDWHTDQGLMLVFSPGQKQGQATDGFFIQLKDGTAVEVDFDADTDDLVIMLGDGVNQYVNPKLEDTEKLRAVPHALKMKANTEQSPRMWYGRMVLPPPNAVHPATQRTFAEMRSSMIGGNEDALALGCASHHQVARELEGEVEIDEDTDEEVITCSEDTSSYCWHRCMNFTDFEEVSPDDCEIRDLSVGCVNEEGLLWTDKHHNPAFQLGCVNLTSAEFIPDPPEETNGEHDGDKDEHEGEDCHTHGDEVHCEEKTEAPTDGALTSGLRVTSALVVGSAAWMLSSLL